MIRGDDKIPFVFPVFVVHDDQHFSLSNILNRVFDRSKTHTVHSP